MSGKVYLVFVGGQGEGASYLLSDASSEEFMGMRCIKGTYRVFASAYHWMEGRVTYVPVSKILLVTEYESFEAYRDSLKRHYEEKAK